MAKSGASSRSGVTTAGATAGATTKAALVEGAIETLKIDGFAGASARTIAGRADLNQALVFYHFGSVNGLLLAALDEVSSRRLASYTAALDGVTDLEDLVRVAAEIYDEDLDRGYVTVLAEMISGASATPGLGAEVAQRIAPWREFAERAISDRLAGSPLAAFVPTADLAHAVVALYLGLEMLSHLDGDRAPALRLFEHAGSLAALLNSLVPQSTPRKRKET
ncbi:MAG TPA: TetR/AcrR family transcriptional regulator [Acidimicrobiales bacterium]|nr:TetR/AcrR family transcriptional regulator [Acidimicrobiales bacterium]